MFLRRRRLIATTGLAAASLGLPRIAIGQADPPPKHHHRRPADRQLGLAGASAGAVERRPARLLVPCFESADHPEPAGQARGDAGPGGELEAHRRAHGRVHPAQGREVPQRRRDDGRRRGLHLQPRAHVGRTGLRHRLEQDAVHLGADPRLASRARSCRPRCRPSPSALLPDAREGRGGRQVHGALHQPRRPTSRSKAASARMGSDIISRRACERGQELDRLGAQAGRDRPLQGARVRARPVADAGRA